MGQGRGGGRKGFSTGKGTGKNDRGKTEVGFETFWLTSRMLVCYAAERIAKSIIDVAFCINIFNIKIYAIGLGVK